MSHVCVTCCRVTLSVMRICYRGTLSEICCCRQNQEPPSPMQSWEALTGFKNSLLFSLTRVSFFSADLLEKNKAAYAMGATFSIVLLVLSLCEYKIGSCLCWTAERWVNSVSKLLRQTATAVVRLDLEFSNFQQSRIYSLNIWIQAVRGNTSKVRLVCTSTTPVVYIVDVYHTYHASFTTTETKTSSKPIPPEKNTDLGVGHFRFHKMLGGLVEHTCSLYFLSKTPSLSMFWAGKIPKREFKTLHVRCAEF